MPRNANQSKNTNYSLRDEFSGGIDLGTTMNITGNLSISGWFKPRGTTANNSVLVGKHFSTSVSPYFIFIARINSSGGVEWRIGTDTANPQKYYSVNSTTIVRDSNNYEGNWFHFTGTWDGVNIKIYINGVLEGTTAAYGNLDATTGLHTSIAALYLSAGSPLSSLNGSSSNVSFFDYALSPSQITTLYGDSTNGPGNPMGLPSPPKAYYPLGTSAWNGDFLSENNAIANYVFDFNSTNTFINVGSLNNFISNNVTISLWANFDTLPNGYDGNLLISTQGTSWDEGLGFVNNGSSGNMRFFIQDWNNIPSGNGGFVDNTTTITINKWFNFVGTWDGTTVKYYINGDLQGSSTYTGSITTTNNLIIGTSYNPIYGIDGKMSNVQIFNTALSATDVETLYNYGSPIRTLANIPQSSNLKGWYKLDASEVYNSTTTEWEVYNNAGYEKTYSFNGSNNIQIPNDSSIQPTSWTIGFWVKGFGQNGTYLFNNSPNGWNIKSSGNDIIISVGTSQSTAHRTATNALNGKWNYIVFSYDGSNVRGSKNGGYLGYNGAYGQTYDSSNLFIGSYSDGTNGFVGEIGQILFWNTRKSNSEGWNSTTQKPITSLPTPQSSNNNNLVSWWKLDTAIITDSFGSNTGINNGAILSNTIIGRPAVIGDGDSSGMSQSNLVQSDLQTVAPYSKYAMNFDGANDSIEIDSIGSTISTMTQISISAWIKTSSSSFGYILFAGRGGSGRTGYIGLGIRNSPTGVVYAVVGGQPTVSGFSELTTTATVNDDNWHHLVMTFNNSNGVIQVYIDGFLDPTSSSTSGLIPTNIIYADIGQRAYNNDFNFDGSISNVSVWNYELNASQVREIYNEGLPSDLNTFSGTAAVAWWQLGENSSFNGNDWICADEKGTNNGESNGMGVGALANGVGTTANGVSTGMAVEDLVGDAPYSTANAISSGMAVTARGTDVP